MTIEGWADEPPVTLPVTSEGGVGCRLEVQPGLLGSPRPPTTDTTVVNVVAYCDAGPITARLAGEGFELQEQASATLYRVSVE